MSLQVRADSMLGQPCLGYSLVTWLPPCEPWRALQRELECRLPVPLALTSDNTLHVSLQLLLWVRDQVTDKAAAWQRIESDVRRALADCASWSPFTLEFDQLRVLERAIILIARENATVTRLRERFMALLTGAGLPAFKHDFIHTTIARFREDALLEQVPVLDVTTVHVRVESVRLVHEPFYGLIDCEELACCRLG